MDFSPQFEMERGLGRGISNGKEEISLDVIREKEVVADPHGLRKAEDEPTGRKMVAGKKVVKVGKTRVEGDPNGKDVTADKTGDDAEKAGCPVLTSNIDCRGFHHFSQNSLLC